MSCLRQAALCNFRRTSSAWHGLVLSKRVSDVTPRRNTPPVSEDKLAVFKPPIATSTVRLHLQHVDSSASGSSRCHPKARGAACAVSGLQHIGHEWAVRRAQQVGDQHIIQYPSCVRVYGPLWGHQGDRRRQGPGMGSDTCIYKLPR